MSHMSRVSPEMFQHGSKKKKERSKKARSPSASLVVVGVGGGIENHHITFFAFLRIHSHILVTGGQYSPSNLHDRKPDNV